MLSTSKGKDSRKIAVIIKNNKIVDEIFINDMNNYSCKKSFKDILDEIDIDDLEKIGINNKDLKKIEKEFNKMIKGEKSIILNDGSTIELSPNEKEPDRIFLIGPSGSGKSTLIAKYIIQYKKMFKNNKVFLFSDKPFDEALDKKEFKLIRIKLDDQLYNDPIQADELKNSLVIFDDTDSIQDNNIKKSVYSLKDQILKRGRSLKIHTMTTSHQTEYKNTRADLNESTGVYIFPNGGSKNTAEYILYKYFSLSKNEVNDIMKLPSRSVFISKTYPNYVLCEKQAYLL